MTLATPSETVVVLNTIDLAIGFLEKQSAITAGRPSSVMANELMGWGNTFTFTQHNQKHKKLRRLLGSALNNTAVQAYTAQQHENVAILLQMIGENSEDF
ncbi:hypothetical protein FRC09_003766 [Ceratobasidium sp. 395]|nr:hypothetical protein FRC09_003766 [Ceratobasidium sp. 395]